MRSIGPAVTREQSPAFLRNSNGRLDLPGPTQEAATGYGIVMPTAAEMKLEAPELLRKNGAFGVKLKAGAPSIHMIRVDIDTEISPMVGDEKQSKDLIEYLSGESPEKLWQSNIFGKSVYELVQDGLTQSPPPLFNIVSKEWSPVFGLRYEKFSDT